MKYYLEKLPYSSCTLLQTFTVKVLLNFQIQLCKLSNVVLEHASESDRSAVSDNHQCWHGNKRFMLGQAAKTLYKASLPHIVSLHEVIMLNCNEPNGAGWM